MLYARRECNAGLRATAVVIVKGPAGAANVVLANLPSC